MALNVIRGLASLKLRRPTDKELATLEPVHMTKDVPWNPSSKYDSAPSINEVEDWFAAFTDFYSLLPATEILRNHNNISVFGANSTLIPRDYDSLRVEEILRKYMIDAHQSEPYQQQQNPVERSIQDI